MDQNTKNAIVFEIDDMFAKFFRSNLERFNSRMPSMIVDGSVQPYQACLPKHISSMIPKENHNPI